MENERNKEIARLYFKGAGLLKIADLFGLSLSEAISIISDYITNPIAERKKS